MRLPISLLVTAAILVLTMAAGSYVDLRNDEMHARQLAVSTGLEKIVRLNQELSGMLMVSVLEQNTLRSASYQTVYDKLELTVKAVEQLTKQLDMSEEISALSKERRELRQVELDALERMEADKWQDARELLFDDTYVLARKIYEINSDTAIGALNGELAATATAFKRIRIVSLFIRAAALVLLLWTGLMFSRRLNQELAEQARLRNEIEAANLRLEEKVMERTSELEEVNRKLADLSVTDGLTGLANRRRFDEVFESEWQRAKRRGRHLAIAMIDVDQFKAYNDYFGHQAGDECLRKIGAVLSSKVQRAGELTARYGGEEFVAILPGFQRDDALSMAEIIRGAVLDLGLEHIKDPGPGVVTVSVGVAALIPDFDSSPENLLRDADAAMYEAKRRGRNNVVLADEQIPPLK